MKKLIIFLFCLSTWTILAADGFVTVTNGITTRGAGSGGGGASPTFDANQFGSGGGGTNILSGALMTNIWVKGSTGLVVSNDTAAAGTQILTNGNMNVGGTLNSGQSIVSGSRVDATSIFGVRLGQAFLESQTVNQACILDASFGIGTLTHKVRNVTKTSNYTMSTTSPIDEGSWFDNIGAGGAVTNTLPTAVRGMTFAFIVDAAQTLCIKAVGSDTIRFRSTVSASAGTAFSSTPGAYIQLVCTAANKWIVCNISGSAVGTTTDWSIQ